MLAKKDFKVNEYITLKLEWVGGAQEQETVIYVLGKWFRQCKYLLLNIPVAKISSLDEIDSIDEATSKLDHSQEGNLFSRRRILAEVEFWGHCSNLQVWAEYDYDTRILHSNLAFPLLKKLTEVGDPQAKKVFREEIAKRLSSGFPPVIEFLTEEGYVKYLTHEEIILAMLETKEAEAILSIEKIMGKPFEILLELPEVRLGPTVIVKNRHVEMLSLFDCDLGVIPYGVKSLNKIAILDLGGNHLSILPEWINELRNLKDLYASGNKISKVPNWIGRLKNLEYLDLSYNNVNEIPEIIGTLKNLKIFYVSDCPIEKIPESLLSLPSLTNFDIHEDFLTNDSKEILIRCRDKIKKKRN